MDILVKRLMFSGFMLLSSVAALRAQSIELKLDLTHATEASIGVAGGVLETKDAGGQLFTLTVPPKALAQETVVRMTPIVSEKGIPLSKGVVAAVHLEPEGLRLWQAALLTITLTKPMPVAGGLPFAYRRGAGEYGVHPMTIAKQVVTFPILHFSGYGLGEGSGIDWSTLKSQKSADVAEQLFRDMGIVLKNNMDHEYSGDEFNAAVRDIFDRFKSGPYADLIRLLGTGPSCTTDKLRIFQLNWIARQAAILGYLWPELPWDRIRKVMSDCTKVVEKLCIDNHDPALTNNLLRHSRELAIIGLGEESIEALDAAKRCGTFRVEFESRMELEGSALVWTRVVSRFITSWYDEMQLPADGENRPRPAEGSGEAPPRRGKCVDTWQFPPEPVVFNLLKTEYRSRSGEGDWDRPFERPDGDIIDFSLRYAPQRSREHLHSQCPGPNGSFDGDLDLWVMAFVVFHNNERTPPMNLLVAQSFTLQPIGGALIAEKIYERTDGALQATESTRIQIFHDPGAR